MVLNKDVNVGVVCKSKYNKDFLIKDRYTLHRKGNYSYMASIEFIDTGYTSDVQVQKVKKGVVIDYTEAKELTLGGIYESNNHGVFTITHIRGCLDVGIRFIATGYCKVVVSDVIWKGTVKDKLRPHIHGVGFVGDGQIKNKRLYSVWKGMLRRCYDTQSKAYSSYGGVGVTVCKHWHQYLNFEEWGLKQEYRNGWEIDKDIFSTGVDRLYCPDSCTFVPQGINALFKHKPNTTGLPEGITYTRGVKQSYIATCNVYGASIKRKSVYCSGIGEAMSCYSNMKTTYVRLKALDYYSKGDLSPKVYDKLKDYTYKYADSV